MLSLQGLGFARWNPVCITQSTMAHWIIFLFWIISFISIAIIEVKYKFTHTGMYIDGDKFNSKITCVSKLLNSTCPQSKQSVILYPRSGGKSYVNQ